MAVTPLDVGDLRLFSVTHWFPALVWYGWSNPTGVLETTPLEASGFLEGEVEEW